MRIYRLEREQKIWATLEEAWQFFSSPANLSRITPPSLDFQIRSPLPREIYPGLMIAYQVRPLFGIPMSWLTEITHVDRHRFFVDEQRAGPYRIWHHEHFFEKVGENEVLVRDLVHYALPFGPFAWPAHELIVKSQLKKIFDYRTETLPTFFPRKTTVG